jgi:hypothetical protein
VLQVAKYTSALDRGSLRRESNVNRKWQSAQSDLPATGPASAPGDQKDTAPRRRPKQSGVLARVLGAESPRSRKTRSPLRGVVMLGLGLLLALCAAVADAYLHRGIETSSEPPFVVQVSGRGLATNIDLRGFPASQVEAVTATIRANGFEVVRHPFVWSEIETDRGVYDWEQYDAIVRSFSDAGVEIVAVIYGTPNWARDSDGAGVLDTPPAEPQRYADFVSVLVERYGQYIRFYQVWDRPNDPNHWGGAPASPSDYLNLLAPSFNAIRTANSEAKVILAEFDPYGGGGALGDDLRFLDGVYDAGGAPYFDVVSAEIDGGSASPFDRRISTGSPSLSRAILFRETVHEHGDDQKPIWFTHYGWDGIESVSRDTQADYLVAGIERMRAEWPWAGLAYQWALRPESVPPEHVGLALLNQDGRATPAFTAVAALAEEGLGTVAATGFVPTDSGPISYTGTWASQHLAGRIFQTTSQTGASLSITFEGTGLIAYLRRSPDAGIIHGTVDGQPLPDWPVEDGNAEIHLEYFQAEDITVPLVSGLDDGTHVVALELASTGKLTIGGMVVSRDPPLRWPVVLALVSALVLIGVAVRDIVIYLGRFSGSIRTVDEPEATPRLPRLPDWRPSLKT